MRRAAGFLQRIEALRVRVEALGSLRDLVALPSSRDLSPAQWTAISAPLGAKRERLLGRLNEGQHRFLPMVLADPRAARQLNRLLAHSDLQLTRAFTYFDTYMDVLTQRSSPELGPLLAGCDVLARDALHGRHPALGLMAPPLVHCDRGFGASILRAGVALVDRTPNPIALIQIPYSRLKEKYNLTSVLHEAGHEAIIRLDLARVLPQALRTALANAAAPPTARELFSLWCYEIGPDFWTFCASGMAQAAGLRDVLSLPAEYVFHVSTTDPHPPPYLRVLLSFEWCRQVWGSGDWDKWEEEWRSLYPLSEARASARRTLASCEPLLPVVSRVLLRTRFRALGGRAIPDLFDLAPLKPSELTKVAQTAASGSLNLKALAPSAQLAVFRTIRDHGRLTERSLDQVMSRWLVELGRAGKQTPEHIKTGT